MYRFRKLCAGVFSSVSILFILCLILVLHSPILASEERKNPSKLTFGFFPIVSTVALYKRFGPLSDYLSASLNQPILLRTAKDFPTFVKRTDQRAYDIVVTAPHFAVRAEDSGKYKIRATPINSVQQLIVVHKNSNIQNTEQLAGKVISTPPQRALMTKMGLQFLRQNGLTDDKKPEFRHFVSHNAAYESVLAGETDAAIASSNVIRKAEKKGLPLKIIAHGLKLPNMATLIASDIDKELADRIVRTLVDMSKTEVGRQVLNQLAFPGYREVSTVDYEVARPYLDK